MSAVTNVLLLSALTICVVFIISFYFKRIPYLDFLVAGAFLPTPIVIMGTVQKMFYVADIVPALLVMHRAVTSRWDSVFDVKWQDWLCLYLLVLGPLFGSLLQWFFGEVSWEFFLLSFYRGASAFVLYFEVRRRLEDREIAVSSIIAVGILLAIFCVGASLAHSLGLVDLDVLEVIGETDSITYWTGGYGGGTIGMYRGEYGAYAAIMVSLAAPWLLSRARYPSAIFLVVAGLYTVSAVGSRQGFAGILLGLFATVAFSFLSGRSKRIGFLVLAATAIAGLIFSVALLLDPVFSDWFLRRFDLFQGGTSEVASAIEYRDERSAGIIENVISNWWIFVFGTGYGGASEVVVSGAWQMTYVDSELLWVLQQNGFIGIILYFILLGNLSYHAYLRYVVSLSSGSISLGILSSTVVALFFLYGHYVMLNWQTAHSPVAYIHWLICAIILSSTRGCTPPEYRIQNQPIIPHFDKAMHDF